MDQWWQRDNWAGPVNTASKIQCFRVPTGNPYSRFNMPGKHILETLKKRTTRSHIVQANHNHTGCTYGIIVERHPLGPMSHQTSTGDPCGEVSAASSRQKELPAGGRSCWKAGRKSEGARTKRLRDRRGRVASTARLRTAPRPDSSSSSSSRASREQDGDDITGFCYLNVLLRVHTSSRMCSDTGVAPPC